MQDMNIDDIQIEKDLNSIYDLEEGFGYAYGKITSLVMTENYDYPFAAIKEDIEKKIEHNMKLEYNSVNELYVLVLTSLWIDQTKS